MEVEFTASFSHQFEQAGLFVRVSQERWVKAGVEFADGQLHIGAVVTDGRSDWSVSPAPDWIGERILIRVSWVGDALTIRAKPDRDKFQLVRVVPFEPDLIAVAGPYACAPTRAGLTKTSMHGAPQSLIAACIRGRCCQVPDSVQSNAATAPGAWAPLRHRRFRMLDGPGVPTCRDLSPNGRSPIVPDRGVRQARAGRLGANCDVGLSARREACAFSLSFSSKARITRCGLRAGRGIR